MNLKLLNWAKNLGNKNENDDKNNEFYKNMNKKTNRRNLTLNNFYKKYNIDKDKNENEIYINNTPKNNKNENNNQILIKRYKDLYNSYIKLEKIYNNTLKEIEYLKNNIEDNNTFINNK